MRIITQSFWAASFFLAQAGASGQNGRRHWGKRQVSGAAPAVTTPKFEGLELSYVTEFETTTEKVTETQMTEVTVAADATTITQIVTQAAEAPAAVTITETVVQPLTVTEVVTVAGEAPAAITVTETVAGACETPANPVLSGTESVAFQNGVGVSTVPIAQSALPTTTFDQDPFAANPASTSVAAISSVPADTDNAVSSVAAPTTAATSSAAASSAAASSTVASSVAASSADASSSAVASSSVAASSSAATSSADAASSAAASSSVATTTSTKSMNTQVTMTQTSASQGDPTDLVASVDLGGLRPNPSAELGSVVAAPPSTEEAEASSVRTRAKINVSTLSLSSVLNLGKLQPLTAGIEARATQAM
ncbi:hypothetical protein BGZ61DRAFT_530931 [Ilyonectria robusta]|uniref:uncharacterized protein n=1 Tax=Ilyonectria robusta TaxID=1079257 RepID=UPI001E8D8037|nr:uncharacterized protein BGZ61DRAFT_530931 [Ilyonectria robusta]KAH8714286.1 hypothetical protein BGZ61DRAFT_530931 [Ilyonectria robusta]